MNQIDKENIEFRLGLPEKFRQEAAILYDEAFRQKFKPIIKSDKKRIEVLTDSICTDFAIVASIENRLLGIAGFHANGNSFTGGANSTDIIIKLGFFKGLKAIILFAMFERKPQADELLMDGIVVDTEMRGKGIGSKLFEALIKYAKEQGFLKIRLDVVDTNPRAKKLYIRMGFVAIRNERLPLLNKIFGFSSYTTMVRKFK